MTTRDGSQSSVSRDNQSLLSPLSCTLCVALCCTLCVALCCTLCNSLCVFHFVCFTFCVALSVLLFVCCTLPTNNIVRYCVWSEHWSGCIAGLQSRYQANKCYIKLQTSHIFAVISLPLEIGFNALKRIGATTKRRWQERRGGNVNDQHMISINIISITKEKVRSLFILHPSPWPYIGSCQPGQQT